MEREGLHFETYVCLQGVTGGCSWKKETRERNTSKVLWLNENGEEKIRVQEKSCMKYAQFDYRLSFVPSSNNET